MKEKKTGWKHAPRHKARSIEIGAASHSNAGFAELTTYLQPYLQRPDRAFLHPQLPVQRAEPPSADSHQRPGSPPGPGPAPAAPSVQAQPGMLFPHTGWYSFLPSPFSCPVRVSTMGRIGAPGTERLVGPGCHKHDGLQVVLS